MMWWAVALVALPLAFFVVWVVIQAPPSLPQLERVTQVHVWQEPLGTPLFDAPTLPSLVQRPPDLSKARWEAISLPHGLPLAASVELPPNAPKFRAWYRISLPPAAVVHPASQGRLALFGNRILGGPWALWVDGHLQQANLADWRIQWNVPLRAALPLGAREVLLAVPYAQPQGYAVSSLFVGPADEVDKAWRERNLWHQDAPRLTAFIALMLLLVALYLAVRRRSEPVFALLAVNALYWAVTSLQYIHDPTGQDDLSRWFGFAVDASVNWTIVLGCLFAFEFEGIRVPRFRALMLIYAVASTGLTLPLWNWNQYGLVAQHWINVLMYLAGLGVLGFHVFRKPRREGVALLLALVAQLALGLHTLTHLTNQTDPDQVFAYPLGVLLLYLAFMYAISRRTVGALETAERHEQELRQRLSEQEQHLAEQHARLQQLEVQRHLTTQHDTIMQDLHDRLGSNLTSALLQARTGVLTPTDTLLLLQDLADELRHMSKSTAADQRGLNEVLAELRQRVQHRLGHGGIKLVWEVDPALPAVAGRETSQHLRALLSEAIANVIKHAQATQIRLEAHAQGDAVLIAVTDNGQGFDPDSAEFGRGLPGMRQRAEILGATLNIESAAQKGCRWVLRLPISEATPAEAVRPA